LTARLTDRAGIIRRLLRLVVAACLGLSLASCQYIALIGGQQVENLAVSPADKRHYQAVVLDNGMRILLVQDALAERSAAAMAVNVGSYQDPAGREGLAHFVEHMLFLGSERFPRADDFTRFVALHGGRYNAYTASDHTNFFFDIEPSRFYAGLDRLSEIFAAPLFNPEYVDKERKAVESEYQLQRSDDNWRISAARRQAMNPQHPAARFNTGNLQTLADKDTSVRDDLLSFYRRYYRADSMVLALVSRHALSTQLRWVRELFGRLPISEPVPHSPLKAPLFRPDQLPALLHIRPKKELKTLTFTFPVPPLQLHYRSKPGHYIAHLLGSESKGSLYAWLKDRGWIESLSASSGPLWRGDSAITLRMALTETGSQQWQSVGDALFAYIRYIRDHAVDRWRFDEISRMLALEFRFPSRSSSYHYARQLSAAAFDYPFVDLLRAPYVMDRWSPETIIRYLDLLTPERALVSRVDRLFSTDRKEPWFDVDYRLRPLPRPVVNRWFAATLPSAVSAPEPNPFIPSNVQLIPLEDDRQKPAFATLPRPERMPMEDIRAWHLTDTSFGLPKTHMRFRLSSPTRELSPKSQAALAVYLGLVDETLDGDIYQAQLAGLYYSLGFEGGGLTLAVGGYSGKQEEFLRQLITALVKTGVDFAGVEEQRKKLALRWRNALLERPYIRNMAALQEALLIPVYRPQEMLAALDQLTAEDVKAWRAAWFEKPALSALFYGNIDRSQAARFGEIVQQALPASSSVQPPPALQLVKLQNAGSRMHREETRHSDSALVLYVQGRDQSDAERARFALFSQMIRADYTDSLRTEKQLGYIAAVRSRTWLKTPGIVFVIQSSSPPSRLLKETRAFIQGYGEHLNGMDPSNFYTYQQALIARMLEQDNNPRSRAARLWSELHLGEPGFDSHRRLAKAVDALTPGDMVKFHKDFVDGLTSRSFVSYSVGSNGGVIEDDDFRTLSQFYELKAGPEEERFRLDRSAGVP